MDRDTDMECEPSPPCVGSGKSKLDTLSKEDLIKFAKKQMAIMQKLKAKCADLDKEMEVLKALPSGNSNDSVIQELTEKMDAVLLQKAENQQSLVLLRKENETFKKQAQEAKDNALQLQEKLDSVKKEHMNKITALEKTLETNKEKHREELKQMEKNEYEEIQRLTAGFNSNIEAVRQEYESQVNTLKHDLEFAKKKHTTEIEALMATHQMGLKKSHENLKNVQDELARQNKHHEHDIRILEEQLEINATHFDMERERFVKELSEQQLYKENCLQDVEEEEEFSGSQKASGVMNMPDATTLEEPNERLRLTLQDLQSQNAMLQEELVFLSNVKTELECNLKHIKEEFAMEREELEFKINELQMMKGDSDPCVEKEPNTLNELRTSSLKLQELQELHKTEMKELETRLICDAEREKEAIIQELNDLQSQCMVLAEEKIAVISEYEHTKEILRNLEMELNDRTCDFVKQYNAMKAQSATSIEELQEQLQEKDDMIKKLKNEVQTSDTSLCKAEPILSTKNEDIIFDLHKTQALCQDVKEIHITMISDPENLIRLEKIRTDIESILDAYRSGHMVTAQLEPQTLQDLWMALEGALAEGRHFRSRIACLEDQLSLLATERGSDDEVRVRDIEDHPDTSQLQDKAYTTPCEQQHGAQRCLCSALVESDAHRQVSEILKQKYSVIIAEEDIAMLFNQLLSRLQIDGMILPQQHFSECEITGRMTDKNDVGTQGTEEDLKSLQLLLSGKEAMIAQLNEEISHLQEFKISTCNRNVTQIEILEKEIKEKDERMNKIKAVAVKAKKELENSKKEACAVRGERDALQVERDKLAHAMRGIIHGAEDYKNLMTSYDRQAELLEKEREKLEGSEKQLVDLTKRLQAAGEQHKQLCSEKEDLSAHIETLQSNVRQLEAQLLETQKLKSVLERDLEAEKLLKEQKSKDHQSAVRDLEETRAVLHQQKQQLQQTEQELEQLRKDAKQSTLLDMEMADYERLVRELNVQLSEKSRMLEQQENLAQAQRDREEKLGQEIESLKSLVEIGEEKTSKMKQLLVKTKKELAEAKQEEASQMVIQSSLKGELEGNLQQLEVYKIQCSELQADRHRLQEQLKSVSEQHQKASSSLQCRLETLQEELSSAKAELCSTLSEFEGYKVRVHNVLKQQKTRSSAPCEGEFSKQEREHMESLMEQLRSKLQESHVQLQSSSTDLQQLQSEHDTLLERHNRMLQQTVAKEAELRERLLSLHSENTALKSEHAQSVAQLTAQADALRSSFREQVRRLQEEERSTVDTLQQQIGRLEAQLFQLQKEPSSTGAATVPQSRKPHADRKLADLPVCELPSLTREEGEGMETTEVESVSSSGSSRPSLEQLLTSPEPKQEPFLWQAEPSKEELSQKLSTATRSMAHMNHLLRESEATNAVLMEQISLLKSELRRLERNQEREKSVANLEYLKNVLLRFMVLQAGSEKQALLPVIHTLLQLSPDEKSKLAAIAQGEEEAEHPGRSGWTSYLHSWYSQMLNAEMLNAEILNAKVLGLVCKGVDAM